MGHISKGKDEAGFNMKKDCNILCQTQDPGNSTDILPIMKTYLVDCILGEWQGTFFKEIIMNVQRQQSEVLYSQQIS